MNDPTTERTGTPTPSKAFRRRGNYDEITARLNSEASRRGWTMRRTRTEVRLLMAEAFCDSSDAVRMLEEGKTAKASEWRNNVRPMHTQMA